MNLEQENRLSNQILGACIKSLTEAAEKGTEESRVERAMRTPGLMLALAKLVNASKEGALFDEETLMLNVLRLGLVTAFSIADVDKLFNAGETDGRSSLDS